MPEKLDNWALGLGIAGFILSIINLPFDLGVFNYSSSSLFSLVLRSLVMIVYSLLFFAGFIVGIIALAKGSDKKWKPILAIILPFLFVLINIIIVIFIMKLLL